VVDDEIRPPTLLELPSYLAGAVARIGHRLLVDALAEHELRLPHFAVLAALSDFGPTAQHQLADRLAMNRSHLVGYLDEVERRGLVRRERDPADRRRQQVSLTPSGSTQVTWLREVARRSQDAFLVTLSEEERATLVTLLRRVVEAADRDRVGPPEAEGEAW
jgi:DNA-binding MarR family transcriptional regulator